MRQHDLTDHRIAIEASRVAVFWAAIPHQIVAFEGQAPYFVVTVPLSGFLSAGLELSIVNRVLQGELMMDAPADACDELTRLAELARVPVLSTQNAKSCFANCALWSIA